MHDTHNLQTMLIRLNEQYTDFLIDAHPEAFENTIDNSDPANVLYDTALKAEFDIGYNEMAKVLGYKDLTDFIALELADEGIFQAPWIQAWSRDQLARL